MQINDFIELGEFSYEVNNWGSCQYSSSLAMYNAYFKLREKYNKIRIQTLENNRFSFSSRLKPSIKKALEEYGIGLYIDKQRSDKDAQRIFKETIHTYRKWPKDIDNIINEYERRFARNIRRVVSADDLFFVCRAAAYDLWTAAPLIARCYFNDFDIRIISRPEIIESAQHLFLTTGLSCAILVDYGIVKNEKSFSNFDT